MKSKHYDPENPDQTGLIYGEPNDVYHKNKAISNSGLNLYAYRPLKYHDTFVSKIVEREQSKAMLEGSLFHSATLESREEFYNQYVTEPLNAPPRPTSAQIKAEKKTILAMERISYWNSFDKVNKDKIIITPDQEKLAFKMKAAILVDDVAAKLLTDCAFEVTFRTEELAIGCSMQCKTDCMQPTGSEIHELPYIVDIKKISSLDLIERHIVEFNYYRQAAYYLKTIHTVLGEEKFHEFFFIFVESTPPYEVAIVKLRDTVLDIATAHISEDLKNYAKAINDSDWPTYAQNLGRRTYTKPWRTEVVDIDDNNIITLDFPTSYYMQTNDL